MRLLTALLILLATLYAPLAAHAQDTAYGPFAAPNAAVATGGTAVTVATGPIKGGFITNGANAASQCIGAAENLYVDMVGTPGSTDANAKGTTVLLQNGQTFYLPPLVKGITVKVNAATSSHCFSVVLW